MISTGHNEDDPKDDGPGLDAFTQAHMLYRDLQLHSEIRGYGTHLCRILQPHLNDVQSLSDSCPNIFDVPQSHTVLLAFVLGIGAMKYHRPLLLPDLVEGIDVTFVE